MHVFGVGRVGGRVLSAHIKPNPYKTNRADVILVRMASKRRIAVLTAVAVSVVVIGVLLIQFFSATSTVDITTASITYSDPWTVNAAFKGIGDYYIQTGYLNGSNSVVESTLQVSFDLYSGSQLNLGLYTRSMTMKVMDAGASTLSFGVNGYTEPPTEYRVDYGYEPPNTKSVTIYTPFVAPGSTWTFTVYVHDPPTFNGEPYLELVIGAQVVENQFRGNTYDLQTNLQIPALI